LVHRANQSDSQPEYQHGIRFHEPDARIVLLVHELKERTD
jgi:hypothetical protein